MAYENIKTFEFGTMILGDQPEEKFREIAYSDLPAGVRVHSEGFLKMIMQPFALPTKDPQCRVSYYLSTSTDRGDKDLLEYRWSINGQPVRLVENRNVCQFQTVLDGKTPTERIRYAQSLTSYIFKLDGTLYFNGQAYDTYRVNIPWPETYNGEVTFSSNADEIAPIMSGWYKRVDVKIEGDIISVLFYNRPPFSPRSGFLPDRNWISGAG